MQKKNGKVNNFFLLRRSKLFFFFLLLNFIFTNKNLLAQFKIEIEASENIIQLEKINELKIILFFHTLDTTDIYISKYMGIGFSIEENENIILMLYKLEDNNIYQSYSNRDVHVQPRFDKEFYLLNYKNVIKKTFPIFQFYTFQRGEYLLKVIYKMTGNINIESNFIIFKII